VIALRLPAICLVTDRRRLPSAGIGRDELLSLERFLDEAIEAGVDLIQIREPDLGAGVLAAFVRRTVRRAERTATRVLVNDRADVAFAAGAAGVHVRADGPAIARLRGWAPHWILGRSAHAGDAAASCGDADYVVFGPVFSTRSKPAAVPAGLEALAAFAGGAGRPVFAIGGITPARAAACCRHGAAGIAAIDVFLPAGAAPAALGPARAVEALRAAMAPSDRGTGGVC
jgi:thiamine-phosphate diphosphorylase